MVKKVAVHLVNNKPEKNNYGQRISPKLVSPHSNPQSNLDDSMNKKIYRGPDFYVHDMVGSRDKITGEKILNPKENFWQSLKSRYLSNQVYTSVENIMDICEKAWLDFVNIKENVRRLCTRKWAYLN